MSSKFDFFVYISIAILCDNLRFVNSENNLYRDNPDFRLIITAIDPFYTINVNTSANVTLPQRGTISDVTPGCTLGIISMIGSIRVSAAFFCNEMGQVPEYYEPIGEAIAGVNGSVYNEYLSNSRLAGIYQLACGQPNSTQFSFIGNQLMFLSVATGNNSQNIGNVGLKIGYENVYDAIVDATTTDPTSTVTSTSSITDIAGNATSTTTTTIATTTNTNQTTTTLPLCECPTTTSAPSADHSSSPHPFKLKKLLVYVIMISVIVII